MPLDADVLRRSFASILERAPDLTARFYDVLFARYPEVQPLFSPQRRARQEEMLARALTAVIDHLDDAAWLEEELAALGAKHVDYGVRPEMYGWVGDALLVTLADAAGEGWTGEVKSQWEDAYAAIVGLMRRGELASTTLRVDAADAALADRRAG